MANNDLLKWVTSDVDFYELLGITFENCSESELRRAYRKTSLKYHPDKLGKDFDPDKYELFQSAYGVLDDPELKAKYDNHRHAKLQRQRADKLFEGKRRQMKEELEARERGDPRTGSKRLREDDPPSRMQQEMRKLAEEGRKRRAARASMMAENARSEAASSPVPPTAQKGDLKEHPAAAEKQPEEEDEVEKLERRIREVEQAKAKRKADKKSRKSGVFVPAESPSLSSSGPGLADRETTTPIKRPDISRGLKADNKTSASPKFSFFPRTPTPKRKDFTATMDRLKAAEKSRLEEEIRNQGSETTS